jgi:hypothetical protein
MADNNVHNSFNSIEYYIIRVLLIVLLLIAAYKLIAHELSAILPWLSWLS